MRFAAYNFDLLSARPRFRYQWYNSHMDEQIRARTIMLDLLRRLGIKWYQTLDRMEETLVWLNGKETSAMIVMGGRIPGTNFDFNVVGNQGPQMDLYPVSTNDRWAERSTRDQKLMLARDSEPKLCKT